MAYLRTNLASPCSCLETFFAQRYSVYARDNFILYGLINFIFTPFLLLFFITYKLHFTPAFIILNVALYIFQRKKIIIVLLKKIKYELYSDIISSHVRNNSFARLIARRSIVRVYKCFRSGGLEGDKCAA